MHRSLPSTLPTVFLLACPLDPIAIDLAGTTGTTSFECHTDADCPAACVDHKCVECATDADCSNLTPICVGEVCQGCSLPGQCPATAPICDADACVPCSDDEQCQAIGLDICIPPPASDAGTCSGCRSNLDCPPEYPECVGMQCTLACETDPWEGIEPLVLDDHLLGGSIAGFVCASDLTDTFMLEGLGPAFVSLELNADTKPGTVTLTLLDANNTSVASSSAHTGLEVIHVDVPAAGSYHVQVSLHSGPAGVPFELSYRTLPQ